MGRANQRPRKGKKHTHLNKVGTRTENERLQHAEGRAVLTTMGLGNMSSTGRTIAYVIMGLVAVGAVLGLMALTVMR